MNIDGAIRSRQNPLPEIPAEVEKGLGCIEAAFGKAWLERGDSPLQRLWQRTDMFATTQPHLLGQALVTMAPHGSWVRDQVGKIKRQEGERRGAMFELVGTPLFIAPGSTVRPTPRNFQGYDAIVTFQDGGILDISMKNFGVSQHERGFLIAAKQSEKRWLEAMAKTGRNGLGLAAIANSPVTVADWASLRAQFPNLVGTQHAEFVKVSGPWTVRVHSVPWEVYPIAPKPLSHQFMVNALPS